MGVQASRGTWVHSSTGTWMGIWTGTAMHSSTERVLHTWSTTVLVMVLQMVVGLVMVVHWGTLVQTGTDTQTGLEIWRGVSTVLGGPYDLDVELNFTICAVAYCIQSVRLASRDNSIIIIRVLIRIIVYDLDVELNIFICVAAYILVCSTIKNLHDLSLNRRKSDWFLSKNLIN